MAQSLHNRIADLCLKHYAKLPKQGKPQKGKEWTLMAAIVLQTANEDEMKINDTGDEVVLKVIAMGTGTKCIGRSRMSASGEILNDSHAEIVTRRAFLRYLYHHIDLAVGGRPSDVMQKTEHSKVKVKENVRFHFFTTHTPCGDASIISKDDQLSKQETMSEDQRLVTPSLEGDSNSAHGQKRNAASSVDCPLSVKQTKIQQKESEEKTTTTKSDAGETDSKSNLTEVISSDIYRTGAKCVPGHQQDDYLPGSHYHKLGLLRTKPGRGERTLSMCCSDKLAKWTVIGYQGALLSHFLTDPIVVETIVVGKCPYDEESMYRAIIGRWSGFTDTTSWKKIPEFHQSKEEFQDAKHLVESANANAVPSNTSIVWVDVPGESVQVAVNGKRQGVTKKDIGTARARCSISKAELFNRFKLTMETWGENQQLPIVLQELRKNGQTTYRQYKDACVSYEQKWSKLRELLKDQWQRAPAELEHFT